MIGSEDLSGDISWTAAGAMNVEGMQELDQAASLKRRQPQGRRQKLDSCSGQPAREARGYVNAEIVGRVQWKNDRRSYSRKAALHLQLHLAGGVSDDKYARLSEGAFGHHREGVVQVDRPQDSETVGRGVYDHDARSDLRQPKRRVRTDREFWIVRENATPIG